ncbi:MAG: substrate-binding domain-containing protein [Lentisphaeria bacterium]|nr:substrate-binding domain-containing protein [Lentisphaeria bacterium]
MKRRIDISKQKILQNIVSGGTGGASFLPSIRELEVITGCCRQTVHNALLELKAAGVLESLPRRGYRVLNAQLARNLQRPLEEMQIAFVLPHWIQHGAASPLFRDILIGAEEALISNGGNLVYMTLPWSANEKKFDLAKLNFKSRKISGAMLVGPTPDFVAEQFIAKSGVPTVLVDNITDLVGTTCVSQDNLGGAARAVRYLVENGHRRIGMISVNPRKMRLNERFAGFYAEMHKKGLLTEIAFVEEVNWDDDTIEGGEKAAHALLQKGLNGATAILALNDNMAFGAMREFQKHGLSIPDDLSIIAIGNDPVIASLCKPRLTTLSVNCQEMGQAGLNALLDIIRYPSSVARTLLLSLTLNEKQSVRNLNTK